MTIFDEVKSLVDVPTAARSYGVEVRRGNMALCPFHRERHPSCKLYADHYYCFGCQAHGDVITLVQELFGLKAIEAVKQINSDFGLGLDLDKPPDMEAVERRRRELARRRAERERIERMCDILMKYYTLLDKYKMLYAPKSPEDEADERYIYAISHMDEAQHMLEDFDCTDSENMRTNEQEVDRIEQEYKECTAKWGDG